MNKKISKQHANPTDIPKILIRVYRFCFFKYRIDPSKKLLIMSKEIKGFVLTELLPKV